jgi:hypothetical protein
MPDTRGHGPWDFLPTYVRGQVDAVREVNILVTIGLGPGDEINPDRLADIIFRAVNSEI